MSVTYYGEQGTGSQPPTDGPAGAIYTNNILYIDAAKTTRLFAGTTGKFVHGNTNARWSVSNGVLTGADAICATC
jgi:hypothetical protein